LKQRYFEYCLLKNIDRFLHENTLRASGHWERTYQQSAGNNTSFKKEMRNGYTDQWISIGSAFAIQAYF
jgi:hypothetical protein